MKPIATERLYTVQQMAYALNMHVSSIEYRIDKLQLKPFIEVAPKKYTHQDYLLVRGFANLKIVEVHKLEVIHHTQTWWIIPSKINYL